MNDRPEPELSDATPYVRRRRVFLPIALFILTCLSTFWAGAAVEPLQYLELSQQVESLLPVRRVILSHYQDGLIYMASLLAILFAHEMGHFVATLVYRIPASFPYFLPLPVTPIGTLGAVISVDGRIADRKQIFDIGLAGPVAGLLVAVPVMCYAAQHLQLNEANGYGGWQLEMPLGVVMILKMFGPEHLSDVRHFWLGHLQGNPLFIAGWVGFLITGLNMVPISQLDGGHVAYCLLGRRAYWLARAILALVAVHVVWSFLAHREPSPWLIMALLVLVIGPYHPPTRDDSVPIGRFRAVVGYMSLVIPLLCLPLQPLRSSQLTAPQDGQPLVRHGVLESGLPTRTMVLTLDGHAARPCAALEQPRYVAGCTCSGKQWRYANWCSDRVDSDWECLTDYGHKNRYGHKTRQVESRMGASVGVEL